MSAPVRAVGLQDKVSVVVLSRLLMTAVDTGTGIALLQLLPKGEFGVLQLLLVVYELGKQLATWGFPESVFYFFERYGRAHQRGFARNTFVIIGTSASLAALGILIAAWAIPSTLTDWSPIYRDAAASYLPLMAVFAVLELPTWPVQNMLLALDRTRLAAAWQVGTSIGVLGALVVPIAMGLGLGTAVYCLVGYGALRLLVTVVMMARVLPAQREPLPAGAVREQIRFAIPLGLHNIVNRFNKYIDKLIVGLLLTEGLLAEYGAATYEVPFIAAFPYAVGTVLITRYVAYDRDGDRPSLLRLWLHGVRKVSLAVVPSVVLCIVAADDIVRLAAGEDYGGAVIVFQMFAFIMLQRVAHYGSMLQAFGNTRGILRITLVMLGLNVLLSVPATLLFGIRGTAAATVFASTVGWLLYLKTIAMHVEGRIRDVMPWSHYGKVLGVSIVAGAVIISLRAWVYPDLGRGAALTLSTLAFYGLYFALGAATRVISREDWRSLGVLLRLRRSGGDGAAAPPSP